MPMYGLADLAQAPAPRALRCTEFRGGYNFRQSLCVAVKTEPLYGFPSPARGLDWPHFDLRMSMTWSCDDELLAVEP